MRQTESFFLIPCSDMLRRFIGIAAVLVTLTGCDDLLSDGGCDLIAKHSVWVEVRDAASGTEMSGGATAWIQDGAFVDTLFSPAGGDHTESYERAGTYNVFVTHPGYRPWSRRGVEVREDECHVRTVRLTARL